MLSKRLQKIASLVNEYKVVYDVGSDHALLPCFLVLNNLSPKVYAGDNKKGPLENAKKNIEKYNLIDKVIPILGNGLDFAPDDSKIVIISGVGFFTVKEILDNADINRFDMFIVEVNKDSELLREYISDHHLNIIDEQIVYDDFYYQIIVFNNKEGKSLSTKEIKYGPVLLKNKTSIFIDYLNDKLNKLENIYKTSKKESLLKEIAEIKTLL